MSTVLRRKFSHNIGVTNTAVGAYTAPSVTTGVFVTSLVIANTTGAQVLASADIFDGSTHISLVTNAPVPAGSALVLADAGTRIVLNSGDQVFVASNTAASLDVNMSVMEIT